MCKEWMGSIGYRMVRRVLMAEVSGWRVRGRPRLGWVDCVTVSLSNRGMTVEAARQCTKDRKEWRAPIHMLLNEFHAAHFCSTVCSFGPPSHALVVITWRGEGCRYMMRWDNLEKGATSENQDSAVKYMG